MHVVQTQEEYIVLVRDEETGTQLYVLVTVDENDHRMFTYWKDYEYFRDVAYDEEMIEFMDDEDNMRKFFGTAKEHVAKLKGWDS